MTGAPFMATATLRYASNCSSSLGSSLASMNRNSERNRPMASASWSRAPLTSSGEPMLQASTLAMPSAVTLGLPRKASRARFSAANCSARSV